MLPVLLRPLSAGTVRAASAAAAAGGAMLVMTGRVDRLLPVPLCSPPVASCAGKNKKEQEEAFKAMLEKLQARLEKLDKGSKQARTVMEGGVVLQGAKPAGNSSGAGTQQYLKVKTKPDAGRWRNGRRLMDRDKLAQSLRHQQIGAVTFWKITDLYADSHLFKYVVEEMYHEARNQGCSWVAAPAPRALPLLGAVAARGGFPACYIHKAGELPGAVVSVKEGPYQLELPADLSLKGHKVALIDDGVSSGGSMIACAKVLQKAGGEVVVFMAPVLYQYEAAVTARKKLLGTLDEAKIFTLFDLGDPPLKIQPPL